MNDDTIDRGILSVCLFDCTNSGLISIILTVVFIFYFVNFNSN